MLNALSAIEFHSVLINYFARNQRSIIAFKENKKILNKIKNSILKVFCKLQNSKRTLKCVEIFIENQGRING